MTKPTKPTGFALSNPVPQTKWEAQREKERITLRAYRERRIYVAGPMTGLPEYNFPLFNSTAERLRSEGWHVENPAEHGHVEGAGWADYLRWDISRIATCGAIYLLPGWSNSKGATLEVHIAGVLGLEVLLADGAEAPTPRPTPATQKLKEQVCISDTNQSAACAVGSVGTTSDAQTTRSTHDAPATQQAVSSAVLKAIREANMQLVRTGDNAFMLVPYKVATAQAAESVPAVLGDDELVRLGKSPESGLPPWGIGTTRADYLRAVRAVLAAARAPAESVGRDAPEAALSPQVHLTRNTLLWWSELASINPQDLVPRIDAVLAANGVNK